MQRIVALLLCLVMLAGCGFNVALFGIGLDEFDGNDMDSDEKAGTILLIAIAIAGSIAGATALG